MSAKKKPARKASDLGGSKGGGRPVVSSKIDPGTPARARASEEEKAEAQRARDVIIRGIMTEMCEGRWQTGKSHRALADVHNVELSTVRGWAAEAALVLRQCRGNPEDIRDEILAGIENCHRFALAENDVRSALSALELRTKVLGLLVTKVQDVTPPRESLWERVQAWFRAPTPELEQALRDAGWRRD